MVHTTRKPLVATALILSGMVALFYATQPPAAVTVTATQASAQTIYNKISLTGTVQLQAQSHMAVDALATVTAVHVAVGDTVAVGDAILTCQPAQSTAAINADWLQSALYDALQAQTVAVFGDGLQSSTTQTTSLAQATTLYATTAGTVMDMPTLGSTLYPTIAAVTIADPANFAVAVQVPELYADKIAVGQIADYHRTTETQLYSATVAQIATAAVQTFSLTGSGATVIDCLLSPTQTPDTLPMIGTSVAVTLYTDCVQNAVVVPYGAVHQVGTQECVYVCKNDGIYQIAVTTGYQTVDYIQIANGICAGDWVLCDATALTEGSRYTIDYTNEGTL